MPSSADAFVTLAGGLTLPREAIELAIDLELRGCTFTVEGDRLTVRPRSRLTPADVAAVKRWKLHLRALLEYQPPTPSWLQ